MILEDTARWIDGFQSPLGMELLATVDWLLQKESVAPELPSLREGLRHWPAGADAGQRKLRIFDDRLLGLALHRIETITKITPTPA